MYSRTLLDILFLIWGQTVADYKMLSFHLSINVIIIVVSFKILDLCPIALFQQLWNTLYFQGYSYGMFSKHFNCSTPNDFAHFIHQPSLTLTDLAKQIQSLSCQVTQLQQLQSQRYSLRHYRLRRLQTRTSFRCHQRGHLAKDCRKHLRWNHY